MTPDREVQAAVRGVFAQFERLGTLRQVLLWHHHEKNPTARPAVSRRCVIYRVAVAKLSAVVAHPRKILPMPGPLRMAGLAAGRK